MWKKVLVVGTTTAAIVGAGTAALAVTGSSSPSPAPAAKSPATAHHQKARGHGAEALRHGMHGTLTVKDAKVASGFQTYDAIRGKVSTVSSTAITVEAADHTTETYVVNSSTIVHAKADGKSKGQAGHIDKIVKGDEVGVLGTGTTTLTATHVVDRTH